MNIELDCALWLRIIEWQNSEHTEEDDLDPAVSHRGLVRRIKGRLDNLILLDLPKI